MSVDSEKISILRRNSPEYGVVNIPQGETSPSSLRSISKYFRSKFVILTTILFATALVVLGSVLLSGGTSETEATPVIRQSAPEENHVDIRIHQGRLRGYIRNSRKSRSYAAFYKVPYARAPLGDLRFKDPEPPRSWLGLRDNPVVAPQCIQREKYPTPPDAEYTVGEEDCLYSNIYVPLDSDQNIPENKSYPVMVYVHGGGVSGNGSRYGADYFMDEDVILITFQYRLGPFGCLSTSDDVIRGNMGPKDQVQMLRWVQENIANFGGDPGRVTIIGNSMGGMNVGNLILSPMTKGLFHRAISQSGGTLCTTARGVVNHHPEDTIKEVAEIFNCPDDDSAKFLDCMRNVDASKLTLAKISRPHAIVIEKRDDDSNFMPDEPYRILEEGKGQPVPYIIGNVNAESFPNALTILEDTEKVRKLNEDFPREAKKTLAVRDASEEEYWKIKDFYFGDADIGNGTMLTLGDLMSDLEHVHCSYATAKMQAKVSNVYLYWLTKPPSVSYAHKEHPGFPMEELGLVSHADELQFEFLYYGYPEIPTGDNKYFKFSEFFVKLWVHFAATGNTSLNDLKWRKMDVDNSDNNVWLELNDNPQETTIVLERMQFWDEFKPEQLIYV